MKKVPALNISFGCCFFASIKSSKSELRDILKNSTFILEVRKYFYLFVLVIEQSRWHSNKRNDYLFKTESSILQIASMASCLLKYNYLALKLKLKKKTFLLNLHQTFLSWIAISEGNKCYQNYFEVSSKNVKSFFYVCQFHLV